MPRYVLPNGVHLNYSVDKFEKIVINSAILPNPTVKVIEIPSNIDGKIVNKIAHDCFEKMDVYKIILPNTITAIHNCAFCNSSIKDITLPKSLSHLGDCAFERCNNLEHVDFNHCNLTNIPTACFYGCNQLTNVKLPESIKTIYRAAFSWCKNLNDIVIPKSVEEIHQIAFYSTYLKSITFLSNNVDIGYNAFGGNNDTIVYCIRNSSIDKNFSSIFPITATKKYNMSNINYFLNEIDESKNNLNK